MSIHVALRHVTSYDYDRLITLEPQVVRLRPAPHCRSKIISYSLKVEPSEHFINWQQDPFANFEARLVFPKKTKKFKVSVDLVTEMSVYNPFDFFLESQAQEFPFKYSHDLIKDLAPYLACDESLNATQRYYASINQTPRRTIDFLVDLNQKLQKDIAYLIRLEPGVQTPDETLTKKSGSCRDSAWLMVQLLRRCGLAARFVSGYLIQLKPDVKSLDGPSGTDVDFTDLHAWCEVFLPGGGWIGFDPTSGLLAGEGHIPLACTPTPSSAAPIEGLIENCEVTFGHEMSISRIYESARVTKPYTENEWSEILKLGDQVDKRLKKGDVRLTMGGEPTFVATDGKDEPEWNIGALGPTKKKYANDLSKLFYKKYGSGGFIHHGQGKWYPGEQLPRWALSICWPTQGQTLWKNPKLFADEYTDSHYTHDDSKNFIEKLAKRLKIANDCISPAFEDTLYYLWREARLPKDVDLFDAKLDDELERARLRRVFENKLDTPVGYLLPLAADLVTEKDSIWHSSHWELKDGRVFLVPGDSSMGYRLPLNSLPFDKNIIRTTLCVETRRPLNAPQNKDENHLAGKVGLIYVFLPPIEQIKDFIHLLQAIEKTAEELKVKVVLEGYLPPRDPTIKMLQITPDPGVIEVNIHPTSSWKELTAQTEFLYDACFKTRLASEKFMTDGRHTGTGGGNHFVMGGATVDDSPFLRKPELLASLILYWHNHPSLSYLFSGMFIGPTSQAPRIDEARNDQLYELEIAIKEIYAARKKHGKSMPPWLVDRTLRNILIDMTGNTHRSEFCIDILFSPDSATGRLGLLELRAFEMPPHAHMSSVQQLLLRSLIARFWEEPYDVPATRWGTALHDKCMLPSFIKMDFNQVLAEMKKTGFAFDDSWFDPHFEFRFPLIGAYKAMGIELSFRNALEPWHVLGEEVSGSGTARYVDSSIERIEIRAKGLNSSRYVVTCNDKVVPFQSTDTPETLFAGIRFKAWNPPSSLHPTIGIHTPLVFHIIDTWMKQSIGSCQYHVTHPGGRSYDSFPVNAYEAESRRLSRFFEIGQSTDHLSEFKANLEHQGSIEFPYTLDLRH